MTHGERFKSEEGVVDRRFRRGARPVDHRIQGVGFGPPPLDGIGQPVAGGPHVGVLAGVDLVVDAEHVEVGLGAQVEDAQVPGGDQSHQLVVGVVGGNHQTRRPVALPERADQSACGITCSECPGLRVEAVAGGRKPGPAPLDGRRRLDPPQFGAGVDTSTAQADRSGVGQRLLVAGRKVRHRRRRASATRGRRSSGGAAPRRSTSRPVRRESGA